MMTSEINNPVSSPMGAPEKIVSETPVESSTFSTRDEAAEVGAIDNSTMIEEKKAEVVSITRSLSDISTTADTSEVIPENHHQVIVSDSSDPAKPNSNVAEETITSSSSVVTTGESSIPTLEQLKIDDGSTTAQTPIKKTSLEDEATSSNNNIDETVAKSAASSPRDSIGEGSQSEMSSSSRQDQTAETPASEPQSPPSENNDGAQNLDASASALKFDDFLASPNANEIVERSPGGRYVRFMEKLGSGASKEVFKAYDTQEGIEVAWNVVFLANVAKEQRQRIVNEVTLLEKLHHHNIISFHGSWVNREKGQVVFVTEILSSGTLKSFIAKVQVIRWKIAKRWATQILKGLEYLHSQDPPVIHRDLKCENIFYNGTSGDLRIGDLGLSTQHRNGKQLSLLGTPEFMAPDMYEDNPYDEKVDVYAFGMCMLEIFTKEIPYIECTNAAQIYKKVSRGVPPESLNRIQSSHAREFVKLCLGYMDENGKFIRPSATELLSHDFLKNWPNDDDEVLVDPPIQEQAIREANPSASSSPDGKRLSTKQGDRVSPTSSSSQQVPSDSSRTSSRHSQKNRSNSLEENEIDALNVLPDSEVNMRKVRVLEGRDKVLKEDNEPSGSKHERQTSSGSVEASASATASVASSNAQAVDAPGQNGGIEASGSNNYLVAAAVIESEMNAARPYEDDILKLILTLPVEGNTKNVQFDFHLVEDDPIQVAKEMVEVLSIPQDAVLEICETISGLACAARISQDKYLARQQSQGQIRSASQQNFPSVASQQTLPSVQSLTTLQPANPEIQQVVAQPVGQVPSQGIMSSTSQQSLVNQQPMVQGLQQQGLPVQDQPVPIVHAQQQIGQTASMPPVQIQSQQVPVPQTPAPAAMQVRQQSTGQLMQAPTGMQVTPQIQATGGEQVGGSHVLQQQPVPLQAQQYSSAMQQQPPPPQQVHVASQPQPPVGQIQQVPVVQQQVPSAQPAHQIPTPQQVVSTVGHTGSGVEANQAVQGQHIPTIVQIQGPETANPQQAILEGSSQEFQETQTNGVHEVSAAGDGVTSEDNDNDEEVSAELRKLDEEFKKTVMRAKKVFDSRMDNIQRLQYQREAQHQKTLNDHEKQRAEFEKRLQQEEIEQNRRIEQLQKEWERKREEVRLTQQTDDITSENSLSSSPPTESNIMIPPPEPTGDDDGPPEII